MNRIVIQKEYKKIIRRRRMGLIALLFLLLILVIYCTKVGYANTSMSDVFSAIRYFISPDKIFQSSAANYKIILLMRLPRVIMGVLAGIGLSTSGTIMQSITRNPLVSPFTIGVSNAAALGAALAIVFIPSALISRELTIIIAAFACSLLCALLLFRVSHHLGSTPTAIVLTGIALNYLFSAASSSIKYFADDRNLSAIVHWAFGSFNGIQWKHNIIVLVVLVFTMVPVLLNLRSLEIISTSDDEYVKSVGVNPAMVRNVCGILSVLQTSVIISFTGVIGFIGIVSPHIGRLLIGNNHKYLLPYSMVIGSILLVLSDTIGRVLIAPTILPVGIIVSFIGTPLFIYLLLKDRKVL